MDAMTRWPRLWMGSLGDGNERRREEVNTILVFLRPPDAVPLAGHRWFQRKRLDEHRRVEEEADSAPPSRKGGSSSDFSGRGTVPSAGHQK